ncbi:autotransporter family protein [Bartonella harrusi]|uniref:Autotransporter outer membrane beta-barrel domain-containing protein n=1 Tax=Bartonella harrusi TaxID=2961895 RepID=A0ABY5ESH2_9HYPH|nr:autotransporter outer membrane beta-barrel domain-containing protein [Bartonella harrusi]UTO28035.1 autotransporter outer membrane beta-barrel domain-containing protein [Bartonella harrusi]
MIKLFRNRLVLYTATTAILSLLQNGGVVGANVGRSGRPVYKITVTENTFGGSRYPNKPLSGEEGERGSLYVPPYNSQGGVHLSGRRGIPLSGEGGDNDSNKYVYKNHSNGKLMLYNGAYYICDNCTEDKIDNKSYKMTNTPHNLTAVTVKGGGTKVTGENVTVRSEVLDKSFLVGVHVLENGKIVLEDPILKGTTIALRASNGVIEIKNGKIEESHEGADATDNSFVLLEDTKIKTANGTASLLSYENSEIWMSGGSVDFMNSYGVSSMLGGKVNLENVKITGKGDKGKDHAVVRMDLGGAVNFKNGIIDVTDAHGILSENTVATFNSILPTNALSDEVSTTEVNSDNVDVTEVNIESSSITVRGKGAYGIYFKGEKLGEKFEKKEDSKEKETPGRLEVVNLQRTMFSVLDDVAIYSSEKTSGVVGLTQSTLSSGSLLLKAENGASVKVLASASTLEGGVFVDDNSTAELYLSGDSTWILKQRQQNNSHESDFSKDLSISLVSLMDSSINFKKLKSAPVYNYQTLNIGQGTGEVYKAQGDAEIYLNTYLNKGGALENQKTDRVLIYGDVAGKTMVHVRAVSGSPGESTGSGGNEQGISIIQVSGEAHQDSFQLDGGYVTAKNSPYQYKLYAYGPKSSLGKASATQRLVKGDGEFWDFRLENGYVDSGPQPSPSPTPPPEPPLVPDLQPRPKAVVPQVPTYLLLPNALFQTGLMNIGNQSKRLEALRIDASGLLKSDENSAFFVRGYGGSHRYTSNLSALEYGYGGELDYNAIEAGVLLQAIENAYGTASFGIMGSYERFSLQPLDVEQSKKSAFDKWSVTAYGGMQHDAGFYVDGLLSYGLFKGDVITLARGKTATLKGNPLSASLTAGKAFMIGDECLIFDPNVQVVYQHLQFDKAHDVDNFDIEMGKLDQWVARVGGRLIKTLPTTDEVRVVSFYGKMYLSHGLGGKKIVHFKDPFQLGAFGSSLETGLGFNAKLSSKFALHGDVVYQHKLTKAGFSGTSFSGGLRYHF